MHTFKFRGKNYQVHDDALVADAIALPDGTWLLPQWEAAQPPKLEGVVEVRRTHFNGEVTSVIHAECTDPPSSNGPTELDYLYLARGMAAEIVDLRERDIRVRKIEDCICRLVGVEHGALA